MAKRGRAGLSHEQKTELWSRWKAGECVSDIARALAVPGSRVHHVLAGNGGMAPMARRRSSRALALTEREEISRGIAAGHSARQIAAQLQRPPCTVTRELARTKMAVALTSSEITERIVHAFVTRPVYGEHVARLIARLGEAHTHVEALMRQHGAELFDTPGRGLFLWAQLPGHADASALANRAIDHNIWLAPGQYFRPHDEPSPWLRFNVAYSAEPALWEFLSRA